MKNSLCHFFIKVNEKYWQIFYEDYSDPVWHRVCTGTSKVPIDDYNSNKNTDGIHYKCEEEILGDKGEDQRGGWENLRYEKEEHNQ